VIGKFKGEYANKFITEIFCLKPKMYSVKSLIWKKEKEKNGGAYIRDEFGNYDVIDSSDMKAKGITKSVVQKQMTHDQYVHALAEKEETFVTQKTIGSLRHQLYTLETRKKALSSFDTKRHYINRIDSLAFGHKNINK